MLRKPSKKDPNFVPVKKRSVVEIKNTDYQPNRNQLRADLCVDATFDQAIGALCKPVLVRQKKSGS